MSGEAFTVLGVTLSAFSLIGFILAEILITIKKKKIINELYGGEKV